MTRKVDYFVSAQTAPAESACTLVELDARYTPALVQGLVRYLGPSFWLSPEDFERGYQATAAQIEALMGNCTEAIVRTLAMMMGYPPDVPLDPVYGTPQLTGDGTNLSELRYDFYDGARAPGVTLRAIRDATERTATATEQGLLAEEGGETVARIAQLALLL